MKLLTNFFLGLTTFLLVACGGSSTETTTTTTNNQDSSAVVEVDSSALKRVVNETLSGSITGTYTFGDQESAEGGGYLAIKKQKGDSLKFELDINIGAPNYNSGTATGVMKLENNVAIFKTTEYSEEEPCSITFTFNSDNSILIEQNAVSSFSCGFGNNVFANGLYTKQKDTVIFKYEGGF
jgi:hypothetical protein